MRPKRKVNSAWKDGSDIQREVAICSLLLAVYYIILGDSHQDKTTHTIATYAKKQQYTTIRTVRQ